MSNVLKLLTLAVGVIITVAVISYVMTINNTSTQLMNTGLNQLNAQLSGLNDSDKAIYDGTTLSGSDVIQAIQKYNQDPNIYVIVSTKLNKTTACNVVYDEELVTRVVGGEAIADVIDAYVTQQSVSGWPKYDAAKHEITSFDESGQMVINWTGAEVAAGNPGIQLVLPTKSKINGYVEGGEAATIYYIEPNGYDGTKISTDSGYISSKATFTASIQKNQNNEVKFITFVQR